MKIGVFSGTFNPVHGGHMALADAAAKEADLDKVVFLPEAKPRRKNDVAPLDKRIDMIKLALGENENFEVYKSQTKSHSAKETMHELYGKYGSENEFFLIMGADVFEYIESWLDYAELAANNSFILGLRQEDDGELAMEIAKRSSVKPLMVVSEFPNLSSSKIRTAIRRGQEVEGVDGRVLNHIKTNKLYEQH